jgi:hypothetical protein
MKVEKPQGAALVVAVLQIEPGQLGLVLVPIPLQVKSIGVERGAGQAQQSGALEGGARGQPVAAFAKLVQIAVSDEQPVAHVKLLAAIGNVHGIVAQLLGE